MLVWAGIPSGADEPAARRAGAEYDPAANRWSLLPPLPIAARAFPTAVWVDKKLVLWGGSARDGGMLADGAAYDPATRRWRPLAASPLTGRAFAQVAWTGREAIFWGGAAAVGAKGLADGAAYDPASDRWRLLPRSPLRPRWVAATAWTGRELIIWGGYSDNAGHSETGAYNDGAAYNPATDTWRLLAPSPLSPRGHLKGVWTGGEMLVFAGSVSASGPSYRTDGAAYNPDTDSWRLLPAPERPPGAHYIRSEIWTGNEMVASSHLQEKIRWVAYDPRAASWRALPAVLPPIKNFALEALWTGSELIAWGPLYSCIYGDCGGGIIGHAGIRLRAAP
jgi:hypothetical protein